MFEHIGWFTGVPDKVRYVAAARRVRDLVAGLAHPPGDREHAVALHHARPIRSFYEHFSRCPRLRRWSTGTLGAAENLRWWQELTGDRVAYWAAAAHTADAAGTSPCRRNRTWCSRAPAPSCAPATAPVPLDRVHR
jgi:erythromycin esterase